MSIGPTMGLAGSVAGSPLAQASGAETDRARQEVGAQQRHVFTEKKAESAAGIGETDGQDHETEERDADGRRLWERMGDGKPAGADEHQSDHPVRGKDSTGQSGSLLDLSG